LDMLREKKPGPASFSTSIPGRNGPAGHYPLVPRAKLVMNEFHFFLIL
jgi:hypothetical protein